MGLKVKIARTENRIRALLPNAYVKIHRYSVRDEQTEITYRVYADKEARDFQLDDSDINGTPMPHEPQGSYHVDENTLRVETEKLEVGLNISSDHPVDLMKSSLYQTLKKKSFTLATDILESGQLIIK